MTKYRNTLLAGVAALAMAAGTGLAPAQTPSGTQQHGGQPSATQAAPSQGSGTSEPGKTQSGESQHRGTGAPSTGMKSGGSGSGMQPQAQDQKKSGPTAAQNGQSGSQQTPKAAQNGTTPSGTQQGQPGKRQAQSADHGKMGRQQGMARDQGTKNQPRQNSAQRERTLRGLQGNAAEPMQGANGAGNVKFSDRQRTTIKRTIIDARGAPRADHVDFDVRVGAVVPHDSIHVMPVPETLVRIEPRWRGLLYFVYEDEIVIVNPSDMHIIAVVAV